MSTAFLLCHGERDTAEADTFVPAGKTISFYADFDEDTFRTVGLAALNVGDLGVAETYEAGQPIPNYVLSAFSDREMAEHLAAESSRTDARLYFLSESPFEASATALCTTPDLCSASYPDHAPGCRGVLNLIAEDTILSVSCRGVMGAPGKGSYGADWSADAMAEAKDLAGRLVSWSQSDPDAAMAYIATLPQATLVELVGAHSGLQQFIEQQSATFLHEPTAVTEAKEFLDSHGDIAFADYAEQFDVEQRSIVFADDDLLTAWWTGTGRKILRNDGAVAFWQFFRGLDPQWLDALAADDELRDGIAAGSQGADVAEAPTWAPTDGDWAQATSLNEPFVKGLDEDVDATWEIGGGLVLLGEPSTELLSRVRQQPDYTSGTFRVERATFGAGSVVFTGVPPVFQDTVTWTVAQFSRKDVEFA